MYSISLRQEKLNSSVHFPLSHIVDKICPHNVHKRRGPMLSQTGTEREREREKEKERKRPRKNTSNALSQNNTRGYTESNAEKKEPKRRRIGSSDNSGSRGNNGSQGNIRNIRNTLREHSIDHVGKTLDLADSLHDFVFGSRCKTLGDNRYQTRKNIIRDSVLELEYGNSHTKTTKNKMRLLHLDSNHDSFSDYRNSLRLWAMSYEEFCTHIYNENVENLGFEMKNVVFDANANLKILGDKPEVMIDAIQDSSFLDNVKPHILSYTSTEWDAAIHQKKGEKIGFQEDVSIIGETGKALGLNDNNIIFKMDGGESFKIHIQFAKKIKRDVDHLCQFINDMYHRSNNNVNMKTIDMMITGKANTLMKKNNTNDIKNLIRFLSLPDGKLNIKNVLNIKRSGDYGQISAVQKRNNEKTNIEFINDRTGKCYLMTSDRLCYLRCKHEMVPCVLVRKNKSVDIFHGAVDNTERFKAYYKDVRARVDAKHELLNALLSPLRSESTEYENNSTQFFELGGDEKEKIQDAFNMIEKQSLMKFAFDRSEANGRYLYELSSHVNEDISTLQKLIDTKIQILIRLRQTPMQNIEKFVDRIRIVYNQMKINDKRNTQTLSVKELKERISDMESHDKEIDTIITLISLINPKISMRYEEIRISAQDFREPRELVNYTIAYVPHIDLSNVEEKLKEATHRALDTFQLRNLDKFYEQDANYIYLNTPTDFFTRPISLTDKSYPLKLIDLIGTIYSNILAPNISGVRRNRQSSDVLQARKYSAALKKVTHYLMQTMDSTSDFQDFLTGMEKVEPQIGGRYTPTNRKRSLGYLMNDETIESGREKSGIKRQRCTTSKKSFFLRDLIENDMRNFDGLSFDVYNYWANSVEVKQDDSAFISDWAAFICILSLLFYVNKEKNNDDENSEKLERELDQMLFTNKNEVLRSSLNERRDYGEYNYADQIMKDILDIPFIKDNSQLQSFIFIEHSLFDDLIFRNPSIADGFDNQLYNTNSRSTSVDKQKSSKSNQESQERQQKQEKQEKQEIQNIYHSLVRLRGDKKDRKTERRASNASQNSTSKSQTIMSENQNSSNSSKKSLARQLSSSQMPSISQSRISTILTQTKKE